MSRPNRPHGVCIGTVLTFPGQMVPICQSGIAEVTSTTVQRFLHLGLPRRGHNRSRKHSAAGTMAGREFFANPFQISMLDRLSDILVSCRPLLGFMSGPLGPSSVQDSATCHSLCDRQHQCRFASIRMERRNPNKGCVQFQAAVPAVGQQGVLAVESGI